MRRRQFLGALGAAAAAFPVVAQGQQLPERSRRLGVMHSSDPNDYVPILVEKALRDSGFIVGRNLDVEYHWANNELNRLTDLAAEVVSRHFDVIAVVGVPKSVLAAKNATNTIPIVFLTAIDPVAAGWVASLNRPGGNMTGVARPTTEIVSKRQALVNDLLPNATKVAWLRNPQSGNSDAEGPMYPVWGPGEPPGNFRQLP